MPIDYRFTADGQIEQQDADGSYSIHTLTGAEKTLFDEKVARWYPLAADNELRTGVPSAVTLAIIFSESGGKPDAHGPQSDYGIGLMMITAQGLKQGLSNEEVFVPENNIRLGTDFLRTLAGKIGGYDPAKLASMYNCGPGANGPKPNANAPWGYCEYRIPDTGAYPYISKVVRAYNYAIQTGSGSASKTKSILGTIGKVLGGILLFATAGAIGVAVADPSRIPAPIRKVIP